MHAFSVGEAEHSDVMEEEGKVASEPSGENLGRSYVIGSSWQPCKLVLAVGQDRTEYDLPVHEVTEYSARLFGGNSKPNARKW